MSRFKWKTSTGKAPLIYPPWRSAFSLNALRRAWTSVRANRGRSGSDGETWMQFERNLEENLNALRRELLEGRYEPQKVTQILVPKPNSRWRPLTLWAVRDRVVQRAVYNYLEPVFEQRFLPCSYGFRSGRKTADAAAAIHKAQQAGARWVLDADIKDCFGQMDSHRLSQQLKQWQVPPMLQTLIERWLKTKVWNAWEGSAHLAGTSQGGVISPLLCNVYLHPFDQTMQRRGLWLVRYADDFVILSRDERAIRRAEREAAKQLKRLGLQIHPQKTRVTTFDEGFQFVGWFFVRDEMFQLR